MRLFSSVLVSSGLAFSILAPLAAWGGPVDINTADARTLAKELNGVGPARAEAIVAYRNEHGPFKSVDDLRLVKNMPQKIIEANRESLRMEGGGRGARPDAKVAAKATAKPAAVAAKP
ncbi:MAG: helix-hairpin-helix domain-containing protein [Gammaproteobacteria bacterium]